MTVIPQSTSRPDYKVVENSIIVHFANDIDLIFCAESIRHLVSSIKPIRLSPSARNRFADLDGVYMLARFSFFQILIGIAPEVFFVSTASTVPEPASLPGILQRPFASTEPKS